MASYLRTHQLWKNARVLWKVPPGSLRHTVHQMCCGADLPICQKALVGYTKCFCTVTDHVDAANDTVTSSAGDTAELNTVPAPGKQRESTVKKTFHLKKLHSRVLDNAELSSEAEALRNVRQDLCEEDIFGKLRWKDTDVSKEKKVAKGRSDKPFKNVGNTERLSSSAQDRDGVLYDGVSRTAAVTSEAEGWTDVFGTLTDEKEEHIELVDAEPVVYRDDEGEVDESEHPYQRLSPIDRRHAPDWYGRQIEKLARDDKVYEAIDMFETTMLKEDRVKPNRYVITVLIGVLGRVGYTKKAFQLFNRMKKFGLEPEDPTYTALFNACSNSPWKEDGLKRAKHLHELLLEKGYQPNMTTCHAMIKAYGVCGDLQRAFVVMDEMLAVGLRPDAETFSFLLMACISDREAGLKHAIEIWRRMRKKKISPEIHQYNLLLRAVRDCGIGSIEFAQLLIRQKPTIDAPHKDSTAISAPWEGSTMSDFYDENMALGGSEEQVRDGIATITTISVEDVSDEDKETSSIDADDGEREHKFWWQYDSKIKPGNQQTPKAALVSPTHEQNQAVLPTDAADNEPAMRGVSVLDMSVPNILNPRGKFQNVMSLNDLDTPTKRLALIGGMPGFLSHMRKDGVKPDIRTFTQLLDVIPSSRGVEDDLFAAMSVNKIKPDVDFFNLLIRKRNLRKDYSGAKDVFGMLTQLDLTPNLHTFGCAAMGCASRSDGLQLLMNMEEIGYEPNVEIFSILIFQSRMNFAYKRSICREMKRSGVKPNENILRRIEQSVALAKQTILKKERRQPVGEYFKSTEFMRDFRHFMLYYKSWLLSMQLDVPPHPWLAYQVPSEHPEDDTNSVVKM